MQNDPTIESSTSSDQISSTQNNDRLCAARKFAAEQYEKLRDVTNKQVNQVRNYTSCAREQLNEKLDPIYNKAKDVHQVSEEFVKQNPTGTVLGALGIGVIIGLLLGRR